MASLPSGPLAALLAVPGCVAAVAHRGRRRDRGGSGRAPGPTRTTARDVGGTRVPGRRRRQRAGRSAGHPALRVRARDHPADRGPLHLRRLRPGPGRHARVTRAPAARLAASRVGAVIIGHPGHGGRVLRGRGWPPSSARCWSPPGGLGIGVGPAPLGRRRGPDCPWRPWLRRVAGASLLVSMPLAAALRGRRLRSDGWLDLPTMARTHGALNVLGFAVPAIVAAGPRAAGASMTPHRDHAAGAGSSADGVADRLRAAGDEVVILSRRTGFDLAPPDVPALTAALQGCDALVHCAGINREIGTQTYQAVHVEGTRQLVQAARAAGVGHISLLSFLRARPDGPTAYHRSKWAAEELVRSSGLPYTVLKAGVIHGRGDHMLDHLSHALHTFPVFGLVGLHERPVRPVAVDDVARILVAAARGDRRLRDATLAVLGPGRAVAGRGRAPRRGRGRAGPALCPPTDRRAPRAGSHFRGRRCASRSSRSPRSTSWPRASPRSRRSATSRRFDLRPATPSTSRPSGPASRRQAASAVATCAGAGRTALVGFFRHRGAHPHRLHLARDLDLPARSLAPRVPAIASRPTRLGWRSVPCGHATSGWWPLTSSDHHRRTARALRRRQMSARSRGSAMSSVRSLPVGPPGCASQGHGSPLGPRCLVYRPSRPSARPARTRTAGRDDLRPSRCGLIRAPAARPRRRGPRSPPRTPGDPRRWRSRMTRCAPRRRVPRTRR